MIGTVEELRRYLHTTGGGTPVEAELLDGLLKAASDRFASLVTDRILEPTPAPVDGDPEGGDPIVKKYRTRGLRVQIPDLRVVDAVVVDGRTVPPDEYSLEGRDGDATYLWLELGGTFGYGGMPAIDVMVPVGNTWVPGGRARRLVTITGWWGPAEPWPRVQEAVLVWAARVYHERAARFADARQDPEGGVASYFRAVPPSIKATADGLRVPGL